MISLSANRVAARWLRQAKLVAPNSTSNKPGTPVQIPGRGRFTAEPLDGDDTFPPAIASYQVVDGWVLYRGTNGSEGVVAGPQRKLDQWARDVAKWQSQRPAEASKAVPWHEGLGGAANVKLALEAAQKVLRMGGGHAEIRVWVQEGKDPQGSASGGILDLVNVHLNGTATYLGGTSLRLAAQVAAHEAAHVVYGPKAQPLLEVLREREQAGEDFLSPYHAVAGHFEGCMEAAALFCLAPSKLLKAAPEVYEAVAKWLG